MFAFAQNSWNVLVALVLRSGHMICIFYCNRIKCTWLFTVKLCHNREVHLWIIPYNRNVCGRNMRECLCNCQVCEHFVQNTFVNFSKAFLSRGLSKPPLHECSLWQVRVQCIILHTNASIWTHSIIYLKLKLIVAFCFDFALIFPCSHLKTIKCFQTFLIFSSQHFVPLNLQENWETEKMRAEEREREGGE